jgi:CheY-like chemotaxis protein
MLRRLIGEDIELSTVLRPDLGRVKVDPAQIEHVILNLALNARDAMPGGGKLTIETANVDLDEAYARAHTEVRPGAYVMLAMSDNGCGMDAETQARIFEPFFTTKEPGRGTGLGLPMVYGTVRQSGGNIWVYSHPGEGTTFKIYLPRVDQPVAENLAAHPQVQPARGNETVLIVEDEEAVRSLVRGVLQRQGYKVMEAADPNQALAVALHFNSPIHLLLSDIVLPQMNGSELAEQLNAMHPETKVLFMSGYAEAAVSHHEHLVGYTAFLSKPFTPAALARKVRETLDIGGRPEPPDAPGNKAQ